MTTTKPAPKSQITKNHWTVRDREKVKAYVQPSRRTIPNHICPGCLRERVGCYHRVFCDKFCEELWRLDRKRKENSMPWDASRKSFFFLGTKDVGSLLVPTHHDKSRGTMKLKVGPCQV